MDFDSMDIGPPANMAMIHSTIPTPVKPDSGFLPAEIWYMIFDLLLDEEDIPPLQSLGRVSRQLRENILAHVPFILTSREQHAQICRAVKQPCLPSWPGVEVCKFLARPPHVPEQDFPFRLNLLYCSGCRCRHPARAFSQAERRKPARRICIGREGYFRPCEHKTLTWAQVEEVVRKVRIKMIQAEEGDGNIHVYPESVQFEDACDKCRMVPDNRTTLGITHFNFTWLLCVKWASQLCVGDRRVNSMARDKRCRDQAKGKVPRHFCNKSNGFKQCTPDVPPLFGPRSHHKIIMLKQDEPITLGDPETRLRFNPPHEWFHAVDPMSYTHEYSRYSGGHCKEQLRCDVDMGGDGGDGQPSSPGLDLPLHLCKDPNCEYYRYEYQGYCPYQRRRRYYGGDDGALMDALHFPVEDGDEEEEDNDDSGEL